MEPPGPVPAALQPTILRVKRLSPLLLALALLAAGFACPALRAGEAKAYRGFAIDDSRIRSFPNRDAIVTAIQEQIDIVCAVGLSEAFLRFARSVPFEVVPPGVIAPGNPGLYSGRTKSVQVTAIVVTAGAKPILLHELLHAYHDQQLPRGFGNQTVARLYDQAKAIPAFAARSHMMQNDREFFACSGTSYLYGVTAQEPFSREKVKASQPALFAYLQQLFGPTTGTFPGSLTRPPPGGP